MLLECWICDFSIVVFVIKAATNMVLNQMKAVVIIVLCDVHVFFVIYMTINVYLSSQLDKTKLNSEKL